MPHRPEDGPTIFVVENVQQQQRLVAADIVSRRAGVVPGMSVAEARALVKSSRVVLAPHIPARDAAALARLARWAERWSPIVEPDPPDGLRLDITGCEHLFQGEARLVRSIVRRLGKLGFTARVAAASTLGVAWAVARFGRATCSCVFDGQEREAIAPLAVNALRVDVETVAGLAEVGVRTIGEILALPRAALPSRYGRTVLDRLDQALGHQPETVFRVAHEAEFTASLDLPGGTTDWESVAAATRAVLDDLCKNLAQHESGLRRLLVRFDRSHDEPVELVVQVTRASRCPKHLWSLLRPRVEGLDMGLGVEAISLHASLVAKIEHEQRGLGLGLGLDSSGGSGEPEHEMRAIAAMLDTIANRLGADRVKRPELLASHRPERAWRLCDVGAQPSIAHDDNIAAIARALCRPTRLFDPPEPASVLAVTPDGPIHRVRWRGEDHAILDCHGPERIGGEWWRMREPSRDYFRVQTQHGLWLWMYQESRAENAWHVHGAWA